MNKKIKLRIAFIILFIFIIILSLINLFINHYKNNRLGKNIKKVTEDLNIYKEETISNINEKQEYKDENDIIIGLYIKNGNSFNLVEDIYECSFDAEDIMGLFYVIPSNEKTLVSSSYKSLYNEWIGKYENIADYKIGYNLSFEMKDGTKIDQIITNPKEAYLMYPKLQCYLYDDINLKPTDRYYHITDETFNDNTICSSIKLVGDVNSNDIVSDVTLTVYTYDGIQDFDENGKYRGNSKYEIKLRKEK